MPCPATARCSGATACCWPTSVDQTPPSARRRTGASCVGPCAGSTAGRGGRAWPSSGRSRRPDLGGDLLDRPPGVDDEVVLGRAAASCRNISRTRSWNSTDSASIRSRSSKRVRPCCGRQVEQHGQVRAQVAGGPAGDPLHLAVGQVAPGALVGQRRVDVAVGDHDRPAGQRRARPPGRRARPCRRRRAAPRCGARSSPVAGSSTMLAQLGADLGVARLVGQQRRRTPRPRATSRSRRAWVDLPAPSPPSSATKHPVAA